MPSIAASDANGIYTKKLIDVYKERIKPTSFLRSFFPAVESPTLEVSIEVQRGKEKIAVDVHRGDSGNRNQWTKSTEKLFIPLYFREWFDATKLQLYDRLYAAQSIEDSIFAALINDVVDHQLELQEKIERAIELMCAQVLLTGVIQMSSEGTGIEVDYARQAGSIVDPMAGNYFANAIDPFALFQAGGTWLRTKGKCQGMTFNAILGETAISDLYGNTIFKARQNLFNMSLDSILPPQANSLGAVFHGKITCGPYTVNLWSYPEYYDNAAGVSTGYIDAKQVIMLPQNPKFKTAFGAVPQVITPGAMPKMGQFIFSDYIDVDKRAHKYEVESCPLPVPTAVDQIYTFRAVAA